MANTLTSLHVHVVFSTKNRERWLTVDVESEVWRYLGGICRTHKFTALQIGGVEDHVHLLLGCPATAALSDFMKRLKGESSKWASGKFPRWGGFGWQDGYGAFSIGHSQIPTTIRYLQTQRVRHRRQRFEDEYRKFLHVHKIEAEERYVFGRGRATRGSGVADATRCCVRPVPWGETHGYRPMSLTRQSARGLRRRTEKLPGNVGT